ncbi:GINS complex, Psf1 component [Ramaria rubella]|nr:GINS complex, Psf1 component [Ramaria rubella]
MSTTHVSTETRMFGDLSAALIQESRRATLTNTLPKYNQPLVHAITREILYLNSALDPLLSKQDLPQGELCAVSIYSTAMMHNRRSLVAYHNHRLNMLKALYWSSGCALPLILNASHIRPNLSPAEVDFLREYDDMVKQFRDEFKDISGGDDLGELASVDITSDILTPPKDLHVLVRVVRPCGTVATELGTIEFQMGERYLVRKIDVEHLIVQGYLEIV